MESTITQFDKIFEYDSKLFSSPAERTNKRLSLAYGHLDAIPNEIISKIAKEIVFLDLSHNEFRNLSFLSEFTKLQTLILDRNYKLDHTTLPLLQNLEILWLNNCNLINISDWLQELQVQCPNLRELSMMCNVMGQTELNCFTDLEESEYRKQVIKILPQLQYFDGLSTTAVRRQNSAKPKLSLTQLDEMFRGKMRACRNFSMRLQRNIKVMDNSNAALLLRPFITLSITAE